MGGVAVAAARESDPRPSHSPPRRRTNIVEVAAGHAFNLVLTQDGKVFTWGRNEQGQVGAGGGCGVRNGAFAASFENVTHLQLEDRSPPLLFRENEKLTYLLIIPSPQLGLGGGISMDVYSMEAVPLLVEALESKKVAHVAAGHSHSAAVTEEGELYMWGMKIHLEPQVFRVGEGDKVWQVGCGGSHTAVVTEDAHQLFTFGKGSSLCLGHGTRSYTPHPKLVADGLAGRGVVKVACGHRHMAVITD